MDQDLRNGLWNGLTLYYFEKIRPQVALYTNWFINEQYNRDFYILFGRMWLDYFKQPIDTLPDDWPQIKKRIGDYYFKCPWLEVYDFLEFVANNFPDNSVNSGFMEFCNMILEREMSAYRFVGGKITQITAPEEVKEIDDALQTQLKPVNEHLSQSLNLLSDRKKPDYRNSIKEAISAVESLCSLIANDNKATLGNALKRIEAKADLHRALKSAFSNLYGYTSDEKGIRHALLEESNIQFEDAKFMLVSCSAFINYLVAKAGKAGIKLGDK
jgi:hypothetical protein